MSDDGNLTERQRQNFADAQHELAGLEVGRQARFLNDGPRSPEAKRKKRERQHFQNRLMELLTDPIYRAKYDGVMQALSHAEQATQTALDQLADQIKAAETTLDEMMDKAARLPDGTRVFRDANGLVRKEDGSVVEDHLADTILWSGDEPGYEDVQARKQHISGLQAQLDDVNDYQNNVLGPARDHVTDPDNPPSLGELDSILGNIRSSMPAVVSSEVAEMTTAPQAETNPLAITMPSLGGKP